MDMRVGASGELIDGAPGSHGSPWEVCRQHWFLLAGALALAIPTLLSVARVSWTTDQGAHAPIVLATGAWLIARNWNHVGSLARPGSAAITATILVPLLLLYIASKITGIIEIEGFVMYGALLAALYAMIGSAAMRILWFPLLYTAFIFPPPDRLVTFVTQPLKLWISRAAVDLFYMFGLPVGHSGVTIQIGQYQVLVAAACAGLNSLISLTAICLFYVYVRHNLNWRYAALLVMAIIPVAVFANFIRVCILILVTYYFGDAAAQGFIHNFAGITMFAVALLTIFGLDALAAPIRRRLAS